MDTTAPFILVPQLSIHPDRLNITTQCIWLEDRRRGNSIKALLNSDHKHNDQISSQAARKIHKAVNYLVFLANEKKLTIVFPVKHLNSNYLLLRLRFQVIKFTLIAL